jgi:hypothetical protein
MKKELLWAQCPLCLNYIKPQISVTIGNDIFPGLKNFSLSKKEIFTLCSPYELKINVKNIIDTEQFGLLNIDKLKIKYPNIFWNCIWYFYLYNLDYSIILPYEVNIYKKIVKNTGINAPFIITKICPLTKDQNKKENTIENDTTSKNEIVINEISTTKRKKFHTNMLIIHNNISFQYIMIKYKKMSMFDFFDSIENKNKYKTPIKKSNNNQDTDANKIDAFKTTPKKNPD